MFLKVVDHRHRPLADVTKVDVCPPLRSNSTLSKTWKSLPEGWWILRASAGQDCIRGLHEYNSRAEDSLAIICKFTQERRNLPGRLRVEARRVFVEEKK